jgi:cytochrome P450
MSASPHVDQPAPIVEGFDPLDHGFVADPAPFFAQARQRHPVFFASGFGCWVLTRHEDIERALLDWETFSNSGLGHAPTPAAFRDRIPDGWFTYGFNAMDPPQHTPVRKLGQQGFLRTRMERLADPLREIADGLIDAFAEDGEADLVEQFFYHMSQLSIVRLLGLPEEELPRLRHLAEDLPIVLTEHIRPMPPEERDERWERVAWIRDWFQQLIDERREEPQEDFISLMVAGQDDPRYASLSDERIITHMTELVFAGTDTTANLLANIVIHVDRQPEQIARLRADPSLWANVVEEGLRRGSPAIGIFRVTTKDVEVGGVQIPSGSRVWLALASAGMDEQRFTCPMDFDVDRDNARHHISFGKGRHMCMGAPLVRVEGPIALQALYERLPGMRIIPGQRLEYDPVLLAPLLKSLRVSW